jgi:hypothetical protein
LFVKIATAKGEFYLFILGVTQREEGTTTFRTEKRKSHFTKLTPPPQRKKTT